MNELKIAFDSGIALDPIAKLSKHCRHEADLIINRKSNRIPQFQAADAEVIWPLLNTVKRETAIGDDATFLEWGCGIGLISMMAAALGWRVTGIDIEPELVVKAREISELFHIDANFLVADMFSPNADQYQDIDLYFVYPWPAQVQPVLELFAQQAKPGAILICYKGGLQYRILRQQNTRVS